MQLLYVCGSNKVLKKYGADQAVVTVVGYYFCDEPIPYRTTILGKKVTLGQFKQHIAKKGNYRLVCCVLLLCYLGLQLLQDQAVAGMWIAVHESYFCL